MTSDDIPEGIRRDANNRAPFMDKPVREYLDSAYDARGLLTSEGYARAEPFMSEAAAREECKRRGLGPDELCADGGIEAWMVVAKEGPNPATNPPAPFMDAPTPPDPTHMPDVFGFMLWANRVANPPATPQGWVPPWASKS